jgi:hypothetical protein
MHDPWEIEFWKMADHSSRKSKEEISLKNIGLICHFPELRSHRLGE